MIGLILKDIINLKQQAKIYLIIIGIWMVAATLEQNLSFFSGIMSIFAILVPISTFSYDEKSKWEKYALTMPVSRKDIVLSKYLLGFGVALLAALISCVVSSIITKDFGDSLSVALAFFLVGVILASVILPIMFQFGVEKGRIVMIVVIMAPTLLGILLQRSSIDISWEVLIPWLNYILPLATFVIALLSLAFSLHIYKKKEF